MPKKSKVKLSSPVSTKVSADEYKALVFHAREHGIPLARYIRLLIVSHAAFTPCQENKTYNREVVKSLENIRKEADFILKTIK